MAKLTMKFGIKSILGLDCCHVIHEPFILLRISINKFNCFDFHTYQNTPGTVSLALTHPHPPLSIHPRWQFVPCLPSPTPTVLLCCLLYRLFRVHSFTIFLAYLDTNCCSTEWSKFPGAKPFDISDDDSSLPTFNQHSFSTASTIFFWCCL